MTDGAGRNYGRTTDGRFASGNSGRPRGARHKTTLLAERLMAEDAENVVNSVIAAARGGDMTAARIVLDRLFPPRRDNLIAFELPPIEMAAEAIPRFIGKTKKRVAVGPVMDSSKGDDSTRVSFA